MGSSQLGALAAFSASVTWAFASARYADATRSAGAVRVNLLRALSATVLWTSALLVMQGPSGFVTIDAEHALLLAVSITCSYGFGDGLFFAAANRIGVSAALAIATIYPLWAALYGTFARGEALGLWRLVGILGCLTGVSWLLHLTRKGSDATKQGVPVNTARVGFALALITSLCWAGNAVALKQGSIGITVYQSSALRFAFGAVILLAQLPFQPRTVQREETVPMTRLVRQLALPLLVDTGLGSLCFVYGLANTDLALGATLSSLSPLVALPVAAAMGQERISLGKVLAVSTTVAGVALLVLSPA